MIPAFYVGLTLFCSWVGFGSDSPFTEWLMFIGVKMSP